MSLFIPLFTPILQEITSILLQDYFTLKIDFFINLYELSHAANIVPEEILTSHSIH